MEIQGLLFKRINEEFELFMKGTGKDIDADISDDQKALIIEEYEEIILKDSLKTLHERYPTFYEAVRRWWIGLFIGSQYCFLTDAGYSECD